ncbi:hypothetical protein [Methylobacterium sp. Leaf456]|uniref:hypothetical protein n=1 Tax=Methylobacterium sp. Leaf456 TaxID=1736382 RepID=UPI0012E3D3CF|nr:hypothetical protein [Methylobacterium sp. Leaf456]
MNDADIARLFAARVAQPLLMTKEDQTSENIINSTRLQHYRKAGLFASHLLDKEIADQIAAYAVPGLSGWLGKLRQMLVDANPTLSNASRQAPIIIVESYDRYTSVKKFTTDEAYIFVDNGLILFLWQMNKAYLSIEPSGVHSTHALATATLAHHAVQLKPPAWAEARRNTQRLFPPPPYRPPQNRDSFDLLLGLTIHHELFVMAHEIAHIELGHLDPNWKPSAKIELPLTASTFLENGLDLNAIKEFEADELALDLVVKFLGQGLDYNIEATIVYLFQFSRYLLYLEMVLRECNDIGGSFVWAARHFYLRDRMSKYDKNIGSAIVNHSEFLEEKLEPAMYEATELYCDILNKDP